MAPANDGRCAAYADGWLPLALQCYLHMLLIPPCTQQDDWHHSYTSTGNAGLQTLYLADVAAALLLAALVLDSS